jgi:molybdate transport system substrate-binding protein
MIVKKAFTALLVVLFLGTSLSLAADQPHDLTVFCAAGLSGAFSELGQLYKNESNVSIAFNFDGAQVLRTQIENGAYADVFVSASNKHMNALKTEGFMDNSSIFVLAKNWQTIVVPKNNPARIENFTDLAKPGIKIVMGSKDLPITDITMQILNKTANDPALGPDFKKKVLSNVVSQETNINFIVAKVALGEADTAFVHKSEVSSEYAAKVAFIEIPQRYNVESEYTMGLLSESKYPEQARKFLDLVKSNEGKEVLANHGYEVTGMS